VHLPHPDITQTTGRRIDVVAGPPSKGRAVGLEVDGVPAPVARRVIVEVAPEAFLIVV
jgi:hypothetical protein